MEIGLEELLARLQAGGLVLLDVRTPAEYTGEQGYPCDPRQGHIPGARHVQLEQLLGGEPDAVRELVGAQEGAEVVAYCHSGQRSGLAVAALESAGYRARNYPGSWHEWSRRTELPADAGS